MANLPESPTYEAGIYQLETTDEVIGGVNGVSNLQGKQLANRTAWLKDRVDTLLSAAGKTVPAFSAANTYTAGTIVAHLKTIWRANTTIPEGPFNPAQWTNLLGTAAAVDVVTSNTDTTAGRATTVGWMGAGARSIPVDAGGTLSTNQVSGFYNYTNHGLPLSTAVGGITVQILATTDYTVSYLGRNGRFFGVTRENGNQSSCEFWTDANLVKTTSPRDRTPGSMLQVDAGGLLGTSGLETTTTPLNDYPIANGFINGSAMTEETPLGVRPMGIQFGATAGNIVQLGGGSNVGPDLRFRKKIGASWAGPFTFWHSGNLTLTTGPADTTAGRALTTGYAGLLSDVAITHISNSTDNNDRKVFALTYAQGEANRPDWVGEPTAHGVLTLPITGTRGIQLLFSPANGENRVSLRTYSNSNFAAWGDFYTTGNTSADVQAMLAAANNTAIRNAIGSLEAQYTVSSTYDAVRTGFWKGTAPGGDAPPNQDENNLAGISVTSPDAGAGFQIVNGAYDKELFFRGFDGTPSSADWKKFFFHGEGGFYGNAVVPGNTNGLDKSQIFYYTAANRPGGFMSANSGQGIHIAVNGSGAGMQLWAHHGAPTPRIAFRSKSNNVWDAPVEILHDKNLAEKMGKVTLVWSGSANSVSLSGYGYGLYMVKCQNVRAAVVYWNGEEDCSVVTSLAPMTAGGLHNVYVNKSGIVTSVQIIVETGSTNANIPINTIYKIG